MSLFVHPRHGMVQEMILKEQAWTAKFIRQQRADKLAETKIEARKAQRVDKVKRRAEETILSFVAQAHPRVGTPLSYRSRSTGSLSLAGSMAMDDSRRVTMSHF
mmetsp:Transcript_53723/g.160272  ORF Transcript_53723/g.160272 Transcript_53723/m.160272 type:complete len:104 (-) Transcript_53723:123-434(-)